MMPEAWFAPPIAEAKEAPTLEALHEMAALYRVPLEAAALRALLFAKHACALVVVEAGRVSWWACSEGWTVYVHRKVPPPEATHAAQVASGARRDASGCVFGATWGEELGGEVELMEHALMVEGVGVASVIAWLVQRGHATEARS
jgi:hypothetical protein